MHIPYYSKFISPTLVQQLWKDSEVVSGCPDLRVARGLQNELPNIETNSALQFVVDVYEQVQDQLRMILAQREVDRTFIDKRTLHHNEQNASVPYQSQAYRTVIS